LYALQALAEMLPHCPHLTDLRFSGTRAGREGSVAVAKALSESPAAAAGNFTSLDLADNTFGPEGGALVASMLSKQVRVCCFSVLFLFCMYSSDCSKVLLRQSQDMVMLADR
jgi:Ran GTPase-activating protein (RanGAP) involved in mRNA processing and transport